MLLFTFLKKNLSKKIMVFLSSCNSVRYHAELLNYIDIPVLDIHVCDKGVGCVCVCVCVCLFVAAIGCVVCVVCGV